MHWSLWAIVHAFLLALFVTAAGCGGGDSGTTDNDTGVTDETGTGDTGRDSAITDSRGDTGSEVTTDSGVDSGDTRVSETSSDSGPDTHADADTGPADSGSDTRADADAGSDTRADADTGPTDTGADTADAPATLVSIAVTPPTPSIPSGTTQPFIATGTYSDGTTKDITSSVTWTSGTPAVATIDAAGVATAVSPGTTTITATLGGKSGTATLTVRPATLVSIAVTPTNPSTPAGTTKQFTATGTYTDGTTKDITATVTWASDNAAVATVSDTAPTKGLAQALTPGTANISATDSATGKSGSTVLTVTAATLSRIDVAPAVTSAPKGTKVSYTATGFYSDGTTKDLTTSVTWSTSDPSVATISNTAPSQGLATAVAVGTVTITATDSSGGSGTATLNVTAAVITAIEVSPATATIPRLSTQQFTATATFSDGTTGDVTKSVNWTPSDPTVASVSNAAGSQGRATGLTGGVTKIIATDPATGVFGTATLTVTSASVVSITVTPNPSSTPLGTTLQFKALATYSDLTTKDVTDTVTWASSDGTVASVSNAAGSQGLATGLMLGTTFISATDPGSGKSDQSLLTVTAAVLQSIEVTPTNPSIPRGTTKQFMATGRYSDGTTKDITSTVTWTSSDPTVATIDTKGLATSPKAGALGPTTITATDPTSSKSGSTTLTVTAAVLVSIDVTPATASIPNGTNQAFVATGTYSDSTTQDLTSSVTWTSTVTTVATVSNTAPTKGLATGVGVGTTQIVATDSSTGINGSATLNVTPGVLTSITVAPASATIPKGTTQQFTATGNYSDGTTKDLTATVTWSPSNPAVATVSNSAPTQGLARGVGVGTATITATDTASGKSGSGTLIVTDAALVSIAVSPPSATAPRGTTQQYKATGTYTDGSTKDITTQVTWDTSDKSVAAISNAAGSNGLATALSPGSVTISAADPGSPGIAAGTATLTVTDATIVSITVTPNPATVARGATRQFTAIATYTDGTTKDVTTLVTWDSSDRTRASISNAAGSKGLATGLTFGPTTITAKDPTTGVVGSATLTVT